MDEPELKSNEVKNGSKENLIEKIIELGSKANIEVEPISTLRRMSKHKLHKKLAILIEEAMKKQLCIEAKMDVSQKITPMALQIATLKLLLNTCNNGIEKVGQIVLPRYGYTLGPFSKQFEEPSVSAEVDR